MNVNLLIIAGRLTRDPDFRNLASGKELCTFSVAVNDGWGREKKVNYFRVEAWGKQALACDKYLSKGSLVHVTGRVRLDTYETKSGDQRSQLSVTANEVVFGPQTDDSGSRGGGRDSGDGYDEDADARSRSRRENSDEYEPSTDQGNDIPF